MRAEDYEYRTRAKRLRSDQAILSALKACCRSAIDAVPELIRPEDPVACTVVALAARSGRKPAA
jgi:hypothetical protein